MACKLSSMFILTMLGMIVHAKPVINVELDGPTANATTAELDGGTSETTSTTTRSTTTTTTTTITVAETATPAVTVKPTTNSVSQLFASYPEPRKLRGLFRYLEADYRSLSIRFRALALWNVSAQNEEEANKLVQQYLHEHHLDKPDAQVGCAPHFVTDYNAHRFPAIIIRGTCSVSTCSPATNIDIDLPGLCVSHSQNVIQVLKFIEETPKLDQQQLANGEGSGEDSVTEPVGKWNFDLLYTTQECMCRAK